MDCEDNGMKIVIQSHAGGLGDCLWYSQAAEALARDGHEVYYTPIQFRNPEIEDLIWKCNPFSSGPSNDPPTISWETTKRMCTEAKSNSPMRRMGEICGYRSFSDYPVIYYKPRFRPEWINRIPCDLTSISQPFPKHHVQDFLIKLNRNGNIDSSRLVLLKSKHQGLSGQEMFDEAIRVHETESIFELCDIIYSCRKFVCVDSGTNSLASAIRGYAPWPDIYCLTTTMSFNDRLFMYPNVHYVVTGALTPDYKEW